MAFLAGWQGKDMPQTDRIEIRAIRTVGVVGVLAEEQRRAQPIEVDLDIHLDLARAGRSDALADTLDYCGPIDVVRRVVAEEGHQLLERVGTRIIEEIFKDRGVTMVEVAVRKLRPPVTHDVATTGVRIRRRRSELGVLQREPVRAFLGLGSNLGDRRAALLFAIRGLEGVTRVSGCYETEPIGGPEGQGPYLNAVVELQTSADPFALLAACKRLEQAAGRVRTGRNGPRTLDIDILSYGDLDMRFPELTIPHPRMFERRFVLAPLAELAPELCPQDWDERLAPSSVRRVEDLPAWRPPGAASA